MQVFNNYGPKGNEELLRGYGFCLVDNPVDVAHFRVGVDPATLRYGFAVPAGTPGGAQALMHIDARSGRCPP